MDKKWKKYIILAAVLEAVILCGVMWRKVL